MNTSSESIQKSEMRLAILILAAGEGSRMGGLPKALLKKDGDSLLRRLLQSIQVLNPVETVVVTGFYGDEIAAEINAVKKQMDYPLLVVKNPCPELGQSSSVRLGLESLKSEYDLLLIALCDQPNIGALEIQALLMQFHELTSQANAVQKIVLPMVNGVRGNPVLFSREVIKEILAIPGMVCRPYMDQHPELVNIFATENQSYVLDVDTLADIQKLGLDSISR